MMAQRQLKLVDERALQVNQSAIVVLVAVAFALGFDSGRWLIALVGVSLGIGAALPGRGPIQLFYRHVLKRFGVVRPDAHPGDPAPHRFAQSLGAVFLLLATLSFVAGVAWLGAALALVVAALALVKLVFGFCLGCWIFLQAARFRGQPRGAS